MPRTAVFRFVWCLVRPASGPGRRHRVTFARRGIGPAGSGGDELPEMSRRDSTTRYPTSKSQVAIVVSRSGPTPVVRGRSTQVVGRVRFGDGARRCRLRPNRGGHPRRRRVGRPGDARCSHGDSLRPGKWKPYEPARRPPWAGTSAVVLLSLQAGDPRPRREHDLVEASSRCRRSECGLFVVWRWSDHPSSTCLTPSELVSCLSGRGDLNPRTRRPESPQRALQSMIARRVPVKFVRGTRTSLHPVVHLRFEHRRLGEGPRRPRSAVQVHGVPADPNVERARRRRNRRPTNPSPQP